jgi:hypothetical protein
MPAQHLIISLVYSLADSCWLAALLWLFYRFIGWLLPLRPVHAYRVASIVVTTLFLGWLSIFISYLSGGDFISSVAFHQLSTKAQFVLPQVWMDVAAGCYIVGLSFHLLRFFYAEYSLRHLLRETAPITGELKLIVDRHIKNFSRDCTVQVFISNRVSSPLTFGWLRPVILFPVAAINKLTINEFESILLHELAHIRRSDFLLQRVFALMEMILFFNFFARDLFRIIRILREECCDDEVLAAGTLPLDYVTALSWCARQGFAFGGTLGAVGTDRELLNRILRMTQPTKVKRGPATPFYWMAVLGIVLGVQFSSFFPPTTVKSGTIAGRTKMVIDFKPRENRMVTAAFHQPIKNAQQASVRKKVSGRMVDKKSDNAATKEVPTPEIIQPVAWQEGNDFTSLQQGWQQIRRLSREELSQLMKEALEEFNMEDKITWARLIRNKMLAEEMRNYSADSSLMVASNNTLDENVNIPEITRVQSKLMLLIWMKWRDKHPTFIEQSILKLPADSSQAVPVTEQ